MKRTAFIFILALYGGALFGTSCAQAASDKSYFENLAYDYGRGLRNIVTAVFEIPITVAEYHDKEGTPGVKHLAGLADGFFQTVTRLGSGAWDLFAGIIPGQQEGYPPDPETLV